MVVGESLYWKVEMKFPPRSSPLQPLHDDDGDGDDDDDDDDYSGGGDRDRDDEIYDDDCLLCCVIIGTLGSLL